MGVGGRKGCLCLLAALVMAAESCSGGSSGVLSSARLPGAQAREEGEVPGTQAEENSSQSFFPGLLTPESRTPADGEEESSGAEPSGEDGSGDRERSLDDGTSGGRESSPDANESGSAEGFSDGGESPGAESSPEEAYGSGESKEEDFFGGPGESPEEGSAGSQETGQDESGENGFSPLWLTGIAAAAAVGLAALLRIHRRRRGNAGGPPRQPEERSQTGEPAVLAAQPQAAPVKEAEGMWIGNAHHIGARQNQQDSFAISDVTNRQLCRDKGIFAVVADGMGGLSNGAQISAMVTSVMLRRFESSPAVPEISAELLQMVHRASESVNGYLGDSVGQSGSTVVAVWVSGMRLHFISVGDSRIYLARGGTLTQLNREHTYASELDEQAARGQISWEEARSDPQRQALTSYIGMGEVERIDRSLHPLTLIAGDRVLLMTDGVFGTLSEQEILEAVTGDAMEAAKRIETKVLEKRKPAQDNFTAVILQWN